MLFIVCRYAPPSLYIKDNRRGETSKLKMISFDPSTSKRCIRVELGFNLCAQIKECHFLILLFCFIFYIAIPYLQFWMLLIYNSDYSELYFRSNSTINSQNYNVCVCSNQCHLSCIVILLHNELTVLAFAVMRWSEDPTPPNSYLCQNRMNSVIVM